MNVSQDKIKKMFVYRSLPSTTQLNTFSISNNILRNQSKIKMYGMLIINATYLNFPLASCLSH